MLVRVLDHGDGASRRVAPTELRTGRRSLPRVSGSSSPGGRLPVPGHRRPRITRVGRHLLR